MELEFLEMFDKREHRSSDNEVQLDEGKTRCEYLVIYGITKTTFISHVSMISNK